MTKLKNVRLQGIDEKLANFRIRKPFWKNGEWHEIRIYPSAAKRLNYLGYDVEPLDKTGPLYRKTYTRKGKQLEMFGEKND